MSDFVTPWTVTHQASLSMGLSKQAYWSGLSFPSPEDLSNQRIKPRSLAFQADSLLSEPPGRSMIRRTIKTLLAQAEGFIGIYRGY